MACFALALAACAADAPPPSDTLAEQIETAVAMVEKIGHQTHR